MEKFGKERNVRHKMGSKKLWDATHLKALVLLYLKLGLTSYYLTD